MEYPKVMLAIDISELVAKNKRIPYPMYASPKFNGVRCHIESGTDGRAVPLTKNNVPIPNKHIHDYLYSPTLIGLDAEIVIGDPFDKDVLRNTQSGVMNVEGKPNFTVYVHDFVDDSIFTERMRKLETGREHITKCFKNIVIVQHTFVRNEEDMHRLEREYLSQGFEEIMLRNPYPLYKHGRAGIKYAELLKVTIVDNKKTSL